MRDDTGNGFKHRHYTVNVLLTGDPEPAAVDSPCHKGSIITSAFSVLLMQDSCMKDGAAVQAAVDQEGYTLAFRHGRLPGIAVDSGNKCYYKYKGTVNIRSIWNDPGTQGPYYP